MSKVTIVDNVLPIEVHKFLYGYMIDEPMWNISVNSGPTSPEILGRVLYDDERNINTKNGAQALSIFVYMLIKEKVDFLSERVRRIHLGAKAAMQDDHFHKDRYDNHSYTVLFYLNPTWKKSWGGHTIVGDEKIEYKPNRAIIYKSNISHRGIAPKGPSFRTYINYVVEGKK